MPITGIACCCACALSGHERRAAEQRDELASSNVEHGASSPALGPRRQR
jgi:hypothetical protein